MPCQSVARPTRYDSHSSICVDERPAYLINGSVSAYCYYHIAIILTASWIPWPFAKTVL